MPQGANTRLARNDRLLWRLLSASQRYPDAFGGCCGLNIVVDGVVDLPRLADVHTASKFMLNGKVSRHPRRMPLAWLPGQEFNYLLL